MLNKVNIPISLGLGIDTKKDEKQLTGALLSLDNAYIKKTGSLSKRNGYLPLSTEIFGSTTLTDALSLSKYDDELVMLSSNNLYSYAGESDKWVDKGINLTTTISTKPVVSNSYSQSNPDLAITGGVAVYVWEDSSGGVRASVIDMQSGASFISDALLHSTAVRPRAIVCNGAIYLFYVVGNTLYGRKVIAGIISDQAEVADDMTAEPFGVTAISTRMVIAYSSTQGMRLVYWHDTLTVGGRVTGSVDPLVTALDASEAIDICYADDLLNIVYSGATNTYYSAFNTDFTENTPETFINDTPFKNIGIISTGTTVDIFLETEALDESDNFISYLQVAAGTPSAFTVIQRAGGLLTRPFYQAGNPHVIVSFQSKTRLQDTHFCIDKAGTIAARILPAIAGGHTATASCLATMAEYDGKYYAAVLKKTRMTDVSIATSLIRLGLNFQTTKSTTAQLGRNLHITGGYVKVYDGFSIVEHNFHLYPDKPTSSVLSTGVQEVGSYQYIIVYEWIDYTGAIHRSETSIPITVTGQAGKGTKLEIPTLRYTEKKGTRTPPIVSVYRTIKAGTLFYKISSDTSPLYNDVTADTVTFEDKTITDVVLQTRQLLYTTGGVVDNTPAPSCTHMKTYKNRLVAVGLENPTELAYSKEFVEGEGISFSETFRKQVDSKGGGLSSLAELDDKLILFKESNIFILTGNGPTDTGTQDDFYVQSLTADIGCSEPESIVETPLGVIFKSKKGIWLLDRGLNTKYIGDKVEFYNSYSITSATLVADLNQVRFTTSQGITLVYDYFYNEWSTFSKQPAVSSINWRGSFIYAKATGETFIEDKTIYSDVGVPIRMRIETGWFALSQLQGFGRIYLLQFLGKYKSPHVLKVSISYDYNNSVKDIYSISIMNRSLLGDPDLVGEVFGGSDDENYQFEIKPRIQKCEAFKLIIEDASPDSTPQEALELSAITISYGQKAGASKLSGARRM